MRGTLRPRALRFTIVVAVLALSSSQLLSQQSSPQALYDRAGEALDKGDAALAIKLKALSDPVRLRLMSVVASHAGGEACVCDLSVGIELTQPTISHHLKILRTAGLLDSERRGSWVYYRIVTDALQQLSVLLGTDALVTSGP